MVNVLHALSLVGLVPAVLGHSWVECTDYRKDIEGQDYDFASCFGWMRGWNDYNEFVSDVQFGLDRGINYQPGGKSATGTWCQKPISDDSDYASSYTSEWPMATWAANSRIRLVWPAKNHANYECFSNIPDNSMRLFYNAQRNPTVDPNALSDWTLVHDWHDEAGTSGVDGVPYQNCPKFCDNTDRAVCYGDFTVPDVSEGYYTFMWYWGFNSEEDLYTSCFEVYISGAEPQPDPTPSPTAEPTPDGATRRPTQNPVTPSPDGDDYLIQCPIRLVGTSSDYDKDDVEDAAQDALGISVIQQFDVTGVSGAFNLTIQVHTDHPADITTAMDEKHGTGELCTELETAFGGACDTPGDILVYKNTEETTTTTPSPASDKKDAAPAVNKVFAIVLALCAAIVTSV